jgi:hypothetical protein
VSRHAGGQRRSPCRQGALPCPTCCSALCCAAGLRATPHPPPPTLQVLRPRRRPGCLRLSVCGTPGSCAGSPAVRRRHVDGAVCEGSCRPD